RLHRLPGGFPIANEASLSVLSTFVFEPIRWNGRWGWRPMCEQEKLAMFHFWSQVGRRMNIKDIPERYEAFERFNVEYERENYRYSDSNRRVGEATREMFVGWLPRLLAPLTRPAIHALLEDPLIEAFGFPKPSPFMRRLVNGTLKLRAKALRFLPPRSKPRLRTEMKRGNYPTGYVIEQLGPPEAA